MDQSSIRWAARMNGRAAAVGIVAGGALFAYGCIWTNVKWIQREPVHPASCPDAIVIFDDTSSVPKPYVQLAMIEADHAPDWIPDVATLSKSLRKRAAKIGATGFVSQPDPHFGLGVFVPGDSARVAEVCAGR
jgi:hypothetical protein